MNNKLYIRDEEILLLGLCRLSFDVEITVMLRALAETTADWQYLSTLANKHGVSALVYHNLEKLDFLQYVPKAIADSLHNSLMVNITRNTSHIEAMGKVLELMKDANIKTVLLKGLALELSVYGNQGLRQMTDVDVLASGEDCLKARNVLMKNGFVSLPLKSALYKSMLLDIGKHLPTLSKNGFSLELHHKLFGAGKNELTKKLYDASMETVLNSQKTYLPGPQLFFLYLVRHLYLHEMNNESQLRLYADLVVLLENHRDEIINYDLLTFAGDAGMGEILAWRLEPLRDLWGISFPDWLNDYINKWYNPDSINKFIYFLKSPKDNPIQDKARRYRNNFKEIAGLHRKILFLLGDLFPTLKFMKKRYNCSSSLKVLLYYPLRFGKLWYLIKAQGCKGSAV